ncbi:O-methyltransferase [Rhodohalobacter mucosus]|uniref:O-methyltransferase n=1 Tax=Rhodohalobacter mucosus TaxID=2079485 RepID=A0A316TX82_9BACT|nr:class I SAM-dependent methyltransferase [Rhodohalobacter mucosus]PWN07242.1 O-methyltransferase [Rhodohalobacter mucosus]
MELVNKRIAEYTESFTTEEPEIVKRLIRASEKNLEHTDMLSGRQTGLLLKLLVQISGAKRVLDVGTFTGYSALMMAGVLPENGELITIEMNSRYREISDGFFSKEPYRSKIRQIMGNALEVIPGLEGNFDLVYLDADKISYPEYWKMIRKKTISGSLIVLDNMLWDGMVLNAKEGKEYAIHKTSELIRDDDEVDQLMLPLRDGVTVVRVK